MTEPARMVGADALPPVPPTLAHLLIDAATRAPQAEALVCGDLRLTYAQYLNAAVALANDLGAQGASGERVALLLGNSAEMAVATFATHLVGAQAVLLNPIYTARELSVIIEDAEPALLLHQASYAELVAAIKSHKGRTQILDCRHLQIDKPAELASPLPTPETFATLQYTGGTTGRPKGVNLKHRSLAINVAQREALLPTRESGERILCVTPLCHSYATSMALYLSAYCAGVLVILPKYSAEAVLKTLESERITIFPGSPTIFVGLMAHPYFAEANFSALRLCYSGSAALPAATLAQWEGRVCCKIYEGFGQTEAGPVLTFNAVGQETKPGAVGMPLPRTEIEIVDLESGRTVLNRGQAGEVRARGPQIMSGYRNALEETAKALRDGWLYTGDIGAIEDDGTLTIRGRKKEMVIVGGYNVFPREVEDVLLSFPGVSEAAVVGAPDSYRGESVRAFVIAEKSMVLDPASLLTHCTQNLARYKVPASIEIRSDLPKTAVGKIDKVALEAEVQAKS
ncbi:AMP-binding protein [Rhodoplanes sp. Z2-YC6860]|uniref:AMP-binding protein n=1 Tax=Rhodoplanes sp. Z2-YC6860 TaxID=674703 RepID=UPI00078BD12F|nr:AMP-binding protein [Rhodoplanes sp. Z2-YC6860]AMN41234.1 long-chain-fatty-acid--CoA ligase 2 [Rhodoplanes sp. Z2-YC6860]